MIILTLSTALAAVWYKADLNSFKAEYGADIYIISRAERRGLNLLGACLGFVLAFGFEDYTLAHVGLCVLIGYCVGGLFAIRAFEDRVQELTARNNLAASRTAPPTATLPAPPEDPDRHALKVETIHYD